MKSNMSQIKVCYCQIQCTTIRFHLFCFVYPPRRPLKLLTLAWWTSLVSGAETNVDFCLASGYWFFPLLFFFAFPSIIPFPVAFCQRRVHPTTLLSEKQTTHFQMWSKSFHRWKLNHLWFHRQQRVQSKSFRLALKYFNITSVFLVYLLEVLNVTQSS